MCDTKAAVLGPLAAVPFMWPVLPLIYMGMESAESGNKALHRQEKAMKLDAQAKQNMIAMRRGQEAAAVAERKEQLTLDTEAAMSDAKLATSEAGVGGGAVRDIARSILEKRLAGINSIDRNADAVQTQLGYESVSVEAGLRRGLSATPPRQNVGLAGTQQALSGMQMLFSLGSTLQGAPRFGGGSERVGQDISLLENIG